MSTVKLVSSDEREFEVSKEISNISGTIHNLCEDMAEMLDTPIHLPNVTGTILEHVLVYCKYKHENPEKPSTEQKPDIDPWDAEFCKKFDQRTLFDLILAANYLEIKPLLDSTCKFVASMIRGKSPEEIRKTFNIKEDFTPEQEEQVRKDNQWCEDI